MQAGQLFALRRGGRLEYACGMTDLAAPSGLTRQQARTLSLAALGGALEFYDFVIFVFFASTMGALFFPPDMPEWLKLVQTFGIFAAGYLARPLGGVVMAHFGDLSGRKRMFMLSILMMAIPTLLMGLLPTYATVGVLAPILLLLLRILQGAAIGGEAPGAWVFVTEHVSQRHRALACDPEFGGSQSPSGSSERGDQHKDMRMVNQRHKKADGYQQEVGADRQLIWRKTSARPGSDEHGSNDGSDSHARE